MYSFFRKVIVLLIDLEYLFSREYPRFKREGLLLDYLKIRVKAFLNRWFHFKKERFLSYTVEIPDYNIFFVEFRQIFIRQTYYPSTAGPAPHIIDCGGNMGLSVLYWKYVFPDAHIKVFEPSKEVIGVLKNNIELNNLDNVEVFEAAVSSSEGKVKIYVRGFTAEGNTLIEDVWETSPTKGNRVFYEVETVKLSNYIDGQVDVLKLDIEGSEGAVLKELHDADKLHLIKECIMEYHYHPTATTNQLDDMLSCLKSNKFESQIYFEEYAKEVQFGLSRDGSYTMNLRTVPMSTIHHRYKSLPHAVQN